jgi:hypothetical protein
MEAGQGTQLLEIPIGRGDRAVEGARLEIVCTPNKGTGGSNPPLSAINSVALDRVKAEVVGLLNLFLGTAANW